MVWHHAGEKFRPTQGRLIDAYAVIGFQMSLDVRPFEQHRCATAFADFQIRNDAASHPLLNRPGGLSQPLGDFRF